MIKSSLKTQPFIFACFLLAVSLTFFACSGDDETEETYAYCVSVEKELCFSGNNFTKCDAGFHLSNNCPYDSVLSSSSGDAEDSSSSGGGSSSGGEENSSSSENTESSSSSGDAQSSSSIEASSSSSEQSSSSAVCTAAYNSDTHYCYTNSEMKEYGFVTDAGGQEYKTVVIGTQTWTAENLNFETASGSWCADNNNEANCEIYGRLYDWATAMNLPEECNEEECASQIETNHQGICPDGWHLPSDEEWDVLVNYVGEDNAGTKLKSTSGWDDGGNGTDDYGFAALPGGYSDILHGPGYEGGYLWASTEGVNFLAAYDRGMSNYSDIVFSDGGTKTNGKFVRCIKN